MSNDELNKAMADLRRTSPSPQLEQRWQRAGERAAREGVQARAPRLLMVWALAGAFAIGALVLASAGRWDEMYYGNWHVERLTVAMPKSGGTWVHLPVNLDHHASEDPVVITLDTPAKVAAYSAHDAEVEKDCTAHRCLHTFEMGAQASKGPPVMVKIDGPGRYEFRVQHRSNRHQAEEHFVVLAKAR